MLPKILLKPLGNWPWKLYACLYLALSATNVAFFFSPKNQIFWYYQVLMAIDIWFLFPYLFNALSVMLNFASLVPLYCFIYNHRILSQRFWGYFFVIRIAMEFFGKSFEMKALQAYFHEDHMTALASVATFILFSLPSYVGLYLYAFGKKTK